MSMSAQSASQTGHHNVIVLAQGDNIHVEVGRPHLRLVPVGARVRKQPRRAIDILNPAFQSVPVVGREEDLRFLHEWLGAEAGIAITAVVGPGGSGKTRLALEILQQLPPDWQGGFLTAEEADRFLGQENLGEWSWQKPTLVVVDYAALMAGMLARWFSELADHAPPEHRLRILLLERHADPKAGWYQDLASGTWHGQAVRELFSPAEPRRITPLREAAERRSVMEAGMEAAAAFVLPGKPVRRLPGPGEDAWFDQRLAASQWADPLLLLMAAVIAASDGLNAALELSRPDLAKTLAMRERDRIRKSAMSPTAGDLLAHVYACVTLCGGLDREQAIQVAKGEFVAEHKQYPGGAGQAVDDLAKYLGAQDKLSPLTPDLLGEALLPVTFGEKGKGAAVTSRLAKVATAGVASSLIRSAQDFGYAGEPWPLEWLKFLIADGQNNPTLLMEIEGALPKDSLTLRELAVGITRSLIEVIAGMGGPSDSSSQYLQSELARLWNNLAVRQSAMGQRAQALASIDEAVGMRRALAEGNPDAFLPDLAVSLNNLANLQSDMGQRAAALASIAEAVRHYRALAEGNPDAFLPDLATSLNNQASRQSDMGQRAQALASIDEAVGMSRELAEGNPDAFFPDLAESLNNQAILRSDMGQRAQALASIEESIRIRRSLAESNPDAFLPDLASSLNNQANRQSQLGQRTQALASIAEAVRHYRALAEGNPDAFLPDLATSLNNQANQQSAIGKGAAALASIEEAVRSYRKLAAANPDAFLPHLAMSLNNLANRQSEMGELAESLASIEESVRIRRTLAVGNPNAFLPGVAKSLNTKANLQSQLGQRAEALASIAEALRHYRGLAEGNPEAFLPDIAASLNNQAVLQSEVGQRAQALASIEEAVRHYRGLAEGNSDAFLPDLAMSLSVLGDCLEGMERLKEAFDASAESLTVLAPVFSKYPGVFDGRAGATWRDYVTRSERLGVEPDFEILKPYMRLIEQGGSNE
jgi:Tetratricopeptide repeat/Anaphase-promoting complex subunit 5